MEQELEKKRGNPNFGKKAKQEINEFDDITKMYHFVLSQSYEKYKPVDKEGGYMSTPPYPPIYQLPSEGITLDDETGKVRRWRCLSGIDTIWVDEQEGVEPNGFEDYEQIIFSHGHLRIRGFEKNKLAVLMNLDVFEGKKNKRFDVQPVYRLVDEDLDLSKQLDSLDAEYDALKIAKECSDDEMLPFAYVLGIDVTQSVKTVRRDFILKAKANPKYFLKYFVDPKNEITFKVYDALNKNIISGSIIEGKLVWSESRKVIMDAPKGSDIAQEIAKSVMKGNEDAIKLVEQLKKM